jgi:hypothetical protein
MEMPQGNSLCSYLKQNVIYFFFLLQNQRTGEQNRPCLGELIPVGGGRRWGKCVEVKMVQKQKKNTC